MAGYATFATTRLTPPDPVVLAAAVKAATSDATASVMIQAPGVWRGKQADDWTPAEIVAVQALIDTTAPATPQLEGQRLIDSMPLWEKAAFLLILDQFNIVRAALPTPLPPVSPAQFLAAIRAKAATL
jgi:hypothetical protein